MAYAGGKYDSMLGFFYSVIRETSDDSVAVFSEFLKDLKEDEERIRKVKPEDELMKRILKDIGYSKKIRKVLEEDEPPEYVKGYIDTFLTETASRVKAFFAELKLEPRSYSVRDRFDNAIEIIASRSIFPKDKRIIATEEDAFRFELSCHYRKEKKRLGLTMSVRFKVEEGEASGVGSSNLTIFDKFAGAIGIGESFAKSVQFSATISEGKTHCDNTCEVYWAKELEM